MIGDRLSASQIDGWRRYWAAEPWGDVRADMRQEAYAQRHLHAIEGVSGLWPHWQPEETQEEIMAKLRRLKAEQLERRTNGA
jgi:hypothetical protein